jgi:hypothetical protein
MNRRLDSWKSIADYLGRDTATARRWEKNLGLPVHRVAGGAGRSVFAYTDDIDAWLASPRGAERQPAAPVAALTGPAASALAPDPAAPAIVPAPVLPTAPTRSVVVAARRAVAAAAVVVALFGTVWWATSSGAASAPLRVTVSERSIVASDELGVERWRHDFPANSQTILPAFKPARVVGGTSQTVYFATAFRTRLPEGPIEGGQLAAFDASGRRQRVFSFDDELRMRGKTFGAPWVLTDYAVAEPEGGDAVAVAAHHYMWSPSVVTVLDSEWRRRATWTHDGWIETLKWVGPQRLVAGGFDQEQDGGFAALLDTTTMQPLRMVVMPRTEVNLVTASRFNRTILQPVNDRLIARTMEMPEELPQGAIDVLYEFTRSLDLTHASFSSRYWEMHRSLEVQGKLRHSQADCPDRNGPRAILEWDPSSGWRRQPIAR